MKMLVQVSAYAGRCGAIARAVLTITLGAAALAACASATPEMAARGVRPAGFTPVSSYTHPQASGRASREFAPPSETHVAGGEYKLGAPYQIQGVWYVPAEEPDYDEVGTASWYGDEFDGKATANGETFDKYAASAAHATLPMPSIVEVTNLDNGRTIRVRLNDRGPYKAGRLIDLSRGAAEELGYMDKGTARVRVRYVGPAKLDATLEPLYVAADMRRPDLRVPVRSGPVAESPLIPAQGASMFDAPPSAPPTRIAGQGGYAVQAGAFSDRTRAENVARSLSSAGAAAIRPIEVAGRQLSRVVVGPWRGEAEAQAGRAQVALLGFADAKVIKF
jgi:rare lipoprotein A